MKKKYFKPDAEYINLEAEDVITGIIEGDQSVVEGDPDWEED